MFLRQKFLLSKSKLCFRTSIMRCQCLGFMALFAISSSNGHMSLKSSTVRFSAWKAGHSFKALGNFRHLKCYIQCNYWIGIHQL